MPDWPVIVLGGVMLLIGWWLAAKSVLTDWDDGADWEGHARTRCGSERTYDGE